jgi:sulfate permease, SulP family
MSSRWDAESQAPPGQVLLSRWVKRLTRPAAVVSTWSRGALIPDLLAGVTVAMVELPQAIAYAAVAGLPAHVGLYSTIVGGIAGSLWGSSRHLATGPTNTTSLLVLSVLAPLVTPGSAEFLVAASLMALLVGGFRLSFGLLGLGFLVNFVSRAVLLGFTAGAGLLIAANQLAPLLGLPAEVDSRLWVKLSGVVGRLDQTHGPALLIGGATILLTLSVNRLVPRLPGSLVALVGVTGAVTWLGADRIGVLVVGDIPGAMPRPTDLARVFSLIEQGTGAEMLTGALAVALLGLVESVSIARSIAQKSGERLDVDQELVGQGVANLATGLLSGYTCSGSFTRSMVSYQAGARTHLSAVFTGLIVLASSLVMAPHLSSLPKAGLAGVLMLVAYGMVDRRSMLRLLRASRGEGAVMVITLLATLLLPLEFAVLSGVIFSLATYVYRISFPRVREVVPDRSFQHFVDRHGEPTCPQLAVVSIQGSLFFGATQHVEQALLGDEGARPERRHLLLRMHGVNHCDFTGLEMLEGVVRAFRERGGDVFMVGVRPAVRVIMYETGFKDQLGEDHFLGPDQAIDHLFETVIDPAICCYECPNRVFAECQAIPKYPRDAGLPPYRPKPIEAWRRIDVEEALRRRRTDLVVDVREPEEHRSGHIPGARSVPLRELLARAAELPRDQPIVLVCRTGRRSQRALVILRDLGLREVRYLAGGILSWKAADLPLELGPGRSADSAAPE